MDVGRVALKAQLLQERKVMRMWHGQMAYLNVCDLCGKANPTDLHECLISRGRALGNAGLAQAVLVCKYNLSLTCNRCNVQLAEIERYRRLLIGKNLDRYGLAPVRAWLCELLFTSESQRQEYVRLVEDIARENRPGRWAEESEPNLWNYGRRPWKEVAERK